MKTYHIKDEKIIKCLYAYADIFCSAYEGWCLDNRKNICMDTIIEWITEYRFDDFKEFCLSKYDLDIVLSINK